MPVNTSKFDYPLLSNSNTSKDDTNLTLITHQNTQSEAEELEQIEFLEALMIDRDFYERSSKY
jgi:hypothetical protein